MKLKLIAILLFLSLAEYSFSQDSIPKDTTNIYTKIEKISEKSKFSKFIHKLIFKSNDKSTPKKLEGRRTKSYRRYIGKVIRNIEIEVYDPFGYSFTDTTEVPNSWIEKTGNTLHIKSRKFTIRNLLLFSENSKLDTLLINESARLIRAQNYVRRVEIDPELVSRGSDSVDVRIVVLDAWSIIPKVNLSTSVNRFRILDRNFVGLGHELRTGVATRLGDGENAWDLRYRIRNFKNTFISSTFSYQARLNESYSKILDIDRPFYSPLARWAGGIYLDEQFSQDSILNMNNELGFERFRYRSFDVWGGHAFRIFKGNTEQERTTNLITSLRYLNVSFQESPSMEYDSIDFFSNQNFVLSTIGIASRQFVQDQYIFNDGRIEDVPVGSIYALTFGNQYKNDQNRVYLGARVAHGKYFNWGYLSSNMEFGSFLNKGKLEQTVFSFQANYFTRLISLGNWKMRQFVKPQFVLGSNRLESSADRVSLDDNRNPSGYYGDNFRQLNEARIPGFNGELLGTSKYVLALQTQFYSPWEVYGFRLNPYINITGGFIADNKSVFDNSNQLYTAFGLGFLVRNDYLVFSTFQFSFSYYPTIPGRGNNLIYTNSFETEDFGFQDFNLGKPLRVRYN